MNRREFITTSMKAIGVGVAAMALPWTDIVPHKIIHVKKGRTITINDEFDDGRLYDLTITGGGTAVLTGSIRVRNLTLGHSRLTGNNSRQGELKWTY